MRKTIPLTDHALPCLMMVEQIGAPAHCLHVATEMELELAEVLGRCLIVAETRCQLHGGPPSADQRQLEDVVQQVAGIEHWELPCVHCGAPSVIAVLDNLMGAMAPGTMHLWQVESMCQRCLDVEGDGDDWSAASRQSIYQPHRDGGQRWPDRIERLVVGRWTEKRDDLAGALEQLSSQEAILIVAHAMRESPSRAQVPEEIHELVELAIKHDGAAVQVCPGCNGDQDQQAQCERCGGSGVVRLAELQG